MYFKGGKTLFRILLSKGPEREVSFKGKQSLSGPAWTISKAIPKISTKIDAFLGGKTLFRILLSKGPEREVSFKGKQSLSGPAWEASVIIPKVSTKLDAF